MDVADSSKDWYRIFHSSKDVDTGIIERSWYQDPTFWLYLIGGTVAVITVVGVGMLAYSYYSEIHGLGDVTPKGKSPLTGLPRDTVSEGAKPELPRFIEGSSKDISQDVFDDNPLAMASTITSRIALRAGNSILSGLSDIKTGISKLNPINLFCAQRSTSNESKEVALNNFLEQQSTTRYNPAFYPFTTNNPYASTIERLRIHILGETASERLNRFMYLVTQETIYY